MSIDETDPSSVPLLPDRYFERLPLWPSADVVDKNIDGLIPAARIKNWEDFDSVVDCCLLGDGTDFVFRGQHNYKWFLKSTLDRFDAPAIDRGFAHEHLRNFRLSVRGRVPDNSILDFEDAAEHLEDTELWAVGQHHGLSTPLIDWTRSPYVALFFAFEKEDHVDWVDSKVNHSRIVFVLNATFLQDLAKDTKRERGVDPKIIEPAKDDHGRLVNQAGLFTIAPYGETLESSLLNALSDSGVDTDDPNTVAKYLCKVHIPNSVQDRQNCLRWLRKMNIHHASLFPDLIGASWYCNELARESVAKLTAKVRSPKIFEEHVSDTLELAQSIEAVSAGASTILDALLVTPELQAGPRLPGLDSVVKAMNDFINISSGVDWYVRENELARLRTFVRRRLLQINFPPEHVKDAAAAGVAKAAELANPLKSGTV